MHLNKNKDGYKYKKNKTNGTDIGSVATPLLGKWFRH